MKSQTLFKRILTMILLLSAFAGLTACQGKEAFDPNATYGENAWKTAQDSGSLEEYIREHYADLDRDALQQEAASDEYSLDQQFKATALLCALEYQSQADADLSAWEDGVFTAEYPLSSSYADRFLQQIHTAGAEFWNAFEDAFYPYDCFSPIFAATTELDGTTLAKLWMEVPEDFSCGHYWNNTIEHWIKAKPEQIVFVGDALIDAGYFDHWSSMDFKRLYFGTFEQPFQIKTIDRAVAYMAYARDVLVPTFETRLNGFSQHEESSLTGDMYYTTGLMAAVDESLSLKDSTTEGLPETIETEGKKVLAFYRNLQTEEFENSPPALQIIGDFMMGLPADEFPASLEDADYYLVLTPNYQYGSYYQSSSGNDTGVQQVFSLTSIDLYDASTKEFLRHLGNVTEEPSHVIVSTYGETGPRYPEIVSADALSFIYHHLNEPEMYVSLVDQTDGRSELAPGESVILGNWEITYHSANITETLDLWSDGYPADAGNLYVQAFFTITNRGLARDTFLPFSNSYGASPEVYLLDAKGEEVYDNENLLRDFNCLNGTSLDPEETADGELLFQIPSAAAKEPFYLYIAITYGNQLVFYPLSALD